MPTRSIGLANVMIFRRAVWLSATVLILTAPALRADSSTPPTREGYTPGTGPGSFDRFYPPAEKTKVSSSKTEVPDHFTPSQGLN